MSNATSAAKFYKLSYGLLEDDEDHDPDWMRQIMYEVLEVVAPSTSSRSYAVYKVPHYNFVDNFQMFAPGVYNVFSVIKCVGEPPDAKVVTELHVEFEKALQESALNTCFGSETIAEMTCQEFDELSSEHRNHQAS
jgi:hypothetical protein